jgi:membrane associated rhomboid family serine protease
LKITPGAMVLAGIEIGMSLIYLLSTPDARRAIGEYVIATPEHVFELYRVWTLATSPFLEIGFVNLILHIVMLWMFIPTLERFWGTARFYRFFAITAIAGTLVGTLVGLAIGQNAPIAGLSPFIYACVVAYGIVYGRQQVQFFGVLPLTGRQFMWGFLAFVALFVVLQQFWALGAAYAASMIAAALMTSKRFSPGLAWKRWRIARARRKLSVIEGGKSARPRDEHKWLN